MSGHKKIAWESWNAKVDLLSYVESFQEPENEDYAADQADQIGQFAMDPSFILEQQRILYTPIGP